MIVGTDRNLNERFRQEPPGQTFSSKLEGMVSDLSFMVRNDDHHFLLGFLD